MICQICGRRETEPSDREVCRVCMGLEAAPMETFDQKEEEASMAEYKCRVCGEIDVNKFYPNVSRYCKKCHNVRVEEHRKARLAKGAGKHDEVSAPMEGSGEASMATGQSPEVVPYPVVKSVCRECGAEFESYRHGGISDMKVCKKCLDIKIRSGEASRLRQIVESKDRPLVVIDFSGDENMLDEIRRTAARERRTVEAQILYWLSSHMTGVEITYV